MVASKPVVEAVTTGASVLGEDPASTRQEATLVAPFQLAATVTDPAPAGCTASDGGEAGCPLHGDRKP